MRYNYDIIYILHMIAMTIIIIIIPIASVVKYLNTNCTFIVSIDVF